MFVGGVGHEAVRVYIRCAESGTHAYTLGHEANGGTP